MSKLWAFGDSFTFGSGVVCKDPDHFNIYWYGNKYKKHAFHQILGKKYNLEVENKGIEGDSNTGISTYILTTLPLIKPGDVVIIGQTAPDRELLIGEYFDGSPWPYTLNHHFCTTPIEELDYYLSDDMKKIWKEASDYWFNVIVEKNHVRDLYYKMILMKWQAYFKSIDVKCVVWSNQLWDVYENLISWTKESDPDSVIDDGHWSPNGHEGISFAIDYILNNTDIHYINIDAVEQFDLLNKFKEQHTYINYTGKIL